MKKERVNEIIGLFFLLASLFTLISLLFYDYQDHAFYTSVPNHPIHNPAGIIGAFMAHYLVLTFGFGSFSVPLLLLFWSSCYFLQKVPEKKFLEVIGILIAIFSVASILSLIAQSSWQVRSGGLLGYFFASILERYFGFWGGLLMAGACLLLATLLFTDFLLYPIFQQIWNSVSNWFLTKSAKDTFVKPKKPTVLVKPKVKAPEDLKAQKRPSKFSELMPIKIKHFRPNTPETSDVKLPKINPISKEKNEEAELKKVKLEIKKATEKSSAKTDLPAEATIQISGAPAKRIGEYVFPSIDLLHVAKNTGMPVEEDFKRNSMILEETFRDFGIEVKVVEVEQGPVITRYEILPAPGMKVARILAYSDDLALALKAPSIRFIAPIPGKSAIGIEVPNSVSCSVFLRELLESNEFKQGKFKLPLTLGKDTSGKSMIADLAEMPHILIAGTTGSGKTVCVNSIIAGLLYSKSPDDLKFVMIDPKMVEMTVYKDLPHMLTPVVTDVKKAAVTLNWVVSEMERRYKFFAHAGARNIQSFNSREDKQPAETEAGTLPEKLPYIVVVIDELADLMMVAQDKVEGAITRLAQLSRAVGIHLILATQRPSVDVITGVIKANFPARISFKVASKVDSRTVLDTSGADKLIGKGDMLFLEPGREKPIRGQAAFVADAEINAVVKVIKQNGSPDYHPEIQQIQEGKTSQVSTEKDEIYDEAVRVILETRQASVSVLQRRLRLGYGRAARIVDMMEQEGIVGPSQGSKPREILIEKFEDAAQP